MRSNPLKRRTFATVIILIVAVLLLFGNQLAGRALDAKLGPLLTQELGLPVQLAPIKADLLQLTAQSSILTMGDAKNPAVVATDVEVSLVLSALLHGEIRLRHASADDLMLRPSRWPSSDTPAAKDYLFLDPWLPADLAVETGRYVSDEGDDYALNQLHWQRTVLEGISVQWWEQRQAGKVTLDVQLAALKNLLLLAPVEIDATMQVANKPDSQVSLKAKIQQGESAAYSVRADIQAADMSAQVNATGKVAWSLPDQSDTSIPELELEQLLALFDTYSDSGVTKTTDSTLASTLPRLTLPAHRGQVSIKEIRLQDETTGDTTFTLTTSEQGVQIASLASKGPAGILTGDLAIKSDHQGWIVSTDATLQAQKINAGLAPQFIGTDWLWHTGHAKLEGSGDTLETLLNSLRGDIALAGHYNNKAATPVSIEARLNNTPDQFALDHIAIVLGKGQISGSASLSDRTPNTLTVNVKSENLSLGFLTTNDSETMLPGIAIPEYLNIFPKLNLDVTVLLKGLETPWLNIIEAQATLQRNAQGGTLIATGTGKHAGTFQLTLKAEKNPTQLADFKMSAIFHKLDLSAIFRQSGVVFSRTSGTMHFAGSGKSINDVFKTMHGSSALTVQLREDDNWQRPATKKEQLLFSGESHLVTDKGRIVGMELQKINIDSFDQDLTGSISIVSGRQPWIIANLKSKELNISELRSLLPQSADNADDAGLFSSMMNLGEAQVSLNAESLKIDDMVLSSLQLEAVSGAEMFDVKMLNFTTHNGSAKSQAKISWEGKQATLKASAELSDIDLDQFLIQGIKEQHVPVSGSAKLTSEGSTIGELASNMVGYINLQATEPRQGDPLHARRKLDMKATRLLDGMHAEITTLQWGESDLSGSIRYYRTTPSLLKIKLHSSALSLLPWENAEIAANAKAKKTKSTKSTTDLSSVTSTSASFVGDILLSPLRFLDGEDKDKSAVTSSEKLFSPNPLPIDAMKHFNVEIAVELDSLESTVINAKALSVNGQLIDGELLLKASLGQPSGGSAEASVNFNAKTLPPVLKFTSTYKNMLGLADGNTFPRSGFISIESHGESEAELAASTSGLLYMELGKGPLDYSSSALFTADLVSSIFTTLIPGIEREKPQLECGVAVALLKDGKGVTPYGFTLRTNDANLLGHIEVDLGQETIHMNLDSRGRQGIGISVGSVFSNAVDIKGPLTDPAIVPNAASILVRGWAAVMTAGLSVLGESMVKRVLASENPCPEINQQISTNLCPKNPLAASSEMVCPKA